MFDDRRPQLHLSVLLLNRARTLSRFSSRLPINPTLMDDSLQRPEKSRKLMSSADILALLLAGLFAVCTRVRFYRPKAIPTGAFGHNHLFPGWGIRWRPRRHKRAMRMRRSPWRQVEPPSLEAASLNASGTISNIREFENAGQKVDSCSRRASDCF